MDRIEFEKIIGAQDKLISELGIDVWVGMEPTFTRRYAETPEWLAEALGPEKLQYAYSLLKEMYNRQPGGVVMHTLGRQYASEELPRWSIGYYQARDCKFTWVGPPDPYMLLEAGGTVPAKPADIELFWQAVNNELVDPLWRSTVFTVDRGLRYRILFRCDGTEPVVDFRHKPSLARSSIHEHKIPVKGLTDDLAVNGDFLLCMDIDTIKTGNDAIASMVIELPQVPDVASFVQLLQSIARAAKEANVEVLAFQGFPPPVDASVAWTTITPDPAVIEINQAPADNAVHFYAQCQWCYSAAHTAGLEPYRLHYNGVVSDSGGGGQFTLGGREPLKSPFFVYPHLLPRLVRYLNAHPALSYWFAPPSIGSSSQSPRTDENVEESFRELSLALEQLDKIEHPEAEFIWHSLSPFLVDRSGNHHRSEINIEKLWNPWLPGRGCLGLVEFRAFRMSRSPQCATAIAVLLRSIVAMLAREDTVSELVEHGSALHDKYALPLNLQADMECVFADLQDAGLAMHDYLKLILLQEPVRDIGTTVFHHCCVELHQALEFWPLVGDAALQEGGSRLVDASTTRLQLSIRPQGPYAIDPDGWQLWFEAYRVPLRQEYDQQGVVYVTGIRYRNFKPFVGLHPGIASRSSITLILSHHELDEALQITYHEWHPHSLPYPGLPDSLEDAAKRRNQRFTTSVIPFHELDAARNPPDNAMTDYCLDLRRLP